MELLNANEELTLEITTQAISQPMTREASTGTTALLWLTTSPDSYHPSQENFNC